MKLDSKGCLIIFVFEISYVLRRIQRTLREILTCVNLGGKQPLRKSGVCGWLYVRLNKAANPRSCRIP
jgi:hypothetical protein